MLIQHSLLHCTRVKVHLLQLLQLLVIGLSVVLPEGLL